MRKMTLLATAALLLATVGLSCSRCQKAQRFDPLSLVPRDAGAVVELAPLGALGMALQRALVLAQSAEEKAQVEELKAQLGFDPTTMEGWRQTGLDPKRPALLIALDVQSEPVLLLPVADPVALEKTAVRLGERLGRTDKVTEPQIAGQRALRLARSFGDREVVLATLLVDKARGYAFVASGAQGAAALERILSTEPANSLAKDQRFAAARGKVRPGALFVWTGGAAAVQLAEGLGGSAEAVSQVIASAGVDGEAVWLDVYAGLSVEARKQAGTALALKATPPDMVGIADADAVMVAAGTANVAAMLKEIESRGGAHSTQDLRALARSAGIDLDRAVLERLRGGIGALLYLEDLASLAPKLRQPRALARSIGQVVQVLVVADLTEVGAKELPEILGGYFQERGLTVTTRSVAEAPVSTVVAEGGGERTELHYAVRKGRLLFGVGTASRFDALLGRVDGAAKGGLAATLTKGMRAELASKPGGQIYLSFTTLAAKLQQLSQSQSLGDPAARSLLSKVGDSLARLGALALVIHAEPEGLRLRARLEAAAGGAERK